jgi:hypothetical protein
MARRRNFRSKTRWRTQPRDSEGKWSKIGGAIGSAAKSIGRAGASVIRRSGVDLGWNVNPWKMSAGGSATYTKNLGAGFASTTQVVTRIHPIGQSPIERTVGRVAEAGLSRIGNKRAQTVARALVGVPGRSTPQAGYRVSGNNIRNITNKEVQNRAKRMVKKKARKARKLAAVERARGVPSTISGQSKATRKQRRK